MQALNSTETSQLHEINVQKNITKYIISIPIPIPRSNSKGRDLNISEQYALNSNVFNPSKMSPPSNWKYRLEQRLRDHDIIKKSNLSINTQLNNIDNE